MSLAEQWLAVKNLNAHSGQANSDQARRDDLCRVARAIRAVNRRPVNEGLYDLQQDLGGVGLDDLDAATLALALGSLRSGYRPSTVVRTLSTTRGFSRWLYRRGHIATDPCDDETLKINPQVRGTTDIRAFSLEEVDAMREVAARPTKTTRSAWPERDVALVEVLSGCGPRATETASLQIRHAELNLDQPMLRIALGTKGAKPRDVPLPRRAVAALERWDQARCAAGLAHGPPDPLFVRRDGRPLDRSFLYRLVGRLASQARVALPGDAAVHAFRHHLGVQLAIRGVAVPVIQQVLGHADPRTTSIYMQLAGRHLTDALDDAGWL